jgi:phosphatidate cytidylyltransferase
MTDDTRRPDDEEPEPTEGVRIVGDDEGPALRFASDDTGPLPHWTEPPTGEVPRIFGDDAAASEVDPWATFSSQAPVWRDDAADGDEVDFSDLAGTSARVEAADADVLQPDEPEPLFGESYDPESEAAAVTVTAREGTGEQPRVTPIRTSGGTTGANRPRPAAARADTGSVPRPSTGGTSGRDMPIAVAVGLGLAAVYVALANLGPQYVVFLVAVLLLLAAVEFYEKVREKGYQPATLVGLVAVLALPFAAFWKGDGAIPVVIALAFVTTSAWFLFSGGIESGPLPNIAITMVGVVYIGGLGSFAALLLWLEDLAYGDVQGDFSYGGIGLLTAAIIGVVANDVGALFFGSSAGRSPVAAWISPNKTWEGLIGGAITTIIALVLTKVFGLYPVDGSWGNLIALAVLVCILAPIGDFTESMFKRNLDVKDFGTLLPGHGGILDRFDGLLFVLPGVYYLAVVLEPWYVGT